ncbi:hypothetical protein RCL_jg23193.t1 [Rhizophagus clarus]|uniref:HTH CENPB-type domain-containing protein n=2 Tax=Rhizophagus clarus TaxID=94130 RepID=A0A8H3QHG4_9GLOM|nr:hypothetical protein RCL_jg23193.t1 [Rhizophagus clarus]
MSLKRITLTETQKRELCVYALNNKRIRAQYVDWIEEKWHQKSVMYWPKLELALKEFILTYQHQTVLSDALLVKKTKMIADGLDIPQDALQFFLGWLHKFKDRNRIHQQKLDRKASSADEAACQCFT